MCFVSVSLFGQILNIPPMTKIYCSLSTGSASGAENAILNFSSTVEFKNRVRFSSDLKFFDTPSTLSKSFFRETDNQFGTYNFHVGKSF